jgi:hypothetical protein
MLGNDIVAVSDNSGILMLILLQHLTVTGFPAITGFLGAWLSPEQRSGLNAGSRIWRFQVRDPLGRDTPGGALVVWP